MFGLRAAKCVEVLDAPEFVLRLHAAHPGVCGVFVDYAVRYAIDVARGRRFYDARLTDALAIGQRPLPRAVRGWLRTLPAAKTLADGVTETRKITPRVLAAVFQLSLAHAFAVAESGSDMDTAPTVAAAIANLHQEDVDQFTRAVATHAAKFKKLATNPIISPKHVAGDCDLIGDTTVIEIKASRRDEDGFLPQLMLYAGMASQNGHTITSGAVFNFARRRVVTYDFGGWRHSADFLVAMSQSNF
jgi:hypothetical protein